METIINEIQTQVNNIRSAVNTKNPGSLTDQSHLSEYASAINDIEQYVENVGTVTVVLYRYTNLTLTDYDKPTALINLEKDDSGN
jgi:hypothetical protein